MGIDSELPLDSSELRCLAEERLRSENEIVMPFLEQDESQRLIHELQVYQVELEMQNDELRQARDEKQSMEALLGTYSDLYDFVPVGYFVLDHAGIIRAVNLTGTGYLGVERSLLVNRRLDLFLSAESQPVFHDFLNKVFERNIKTTCEVVFLKERHSPLFVQIEAVVSESGDHCRAVIIDMTGRKLVEEAIRRGKTEWERTFDSVSDLIAIIDNQHRIQRVNIAMARRIGLKPKDCIGRNCYEVVHGLSEPPEFCPHMRTLRDGCEYSEEVHEVNLGGDFLISTNPLHDEKGMMIGSVQVVHDITERKKLQDELIKMQKLESLGVLAGGIAHDFNNILTGIIGNLSFANMQIDPTTGIAKRLNECEKAAMQASELTRQLLTFARGGDPVRKIFDPFGIIKQNAAFILRGSNVRCITELADDLWRLDADEGQFKQVLNNLLLNAAQSMPGGGKIMLRGANAVFQPGNSRQLSPGEYIRIDIEDHGCGIPRENLGKIFDPYFTTKQNGYGLGLASVYSIVKRHGGDIQVSSFVGVGSCFTIILPAVPSRVEELGTAAEAVAPARGGRILIMDDEEFIREIVSEILEFLGYDVESCADGREALERCRAASECRAPFDAVILDLTIPGGMGGKETAPLIREIDPAIVLIVSSGYSDDPVIANYRDYCFDGAIPKPFDAGTLGRELARLVSNSR